MHYVLCALVGLVVFVGGYFTVCLIGWLAGYKWHYGTHNWTTNETPYFVLGLGTLAVLFIISAISYGCFLIGCEIVQYLSK